MNHEECYRCGFCCKLAGERFEPLRKSEGGSECKNFEYPNICTIWEDRPPICRTEYMVDYWEKNGIIDKKNYHLLHNAVCKRAMKEKDISLNKLDKIFREEHERLIQQKGIKIFKEGLKNENFN